MIRPSAGMISAKTLPKMGPKGAPKPSLAAIRQNPRRWTRTLALAVGCLWLASRLVKSTLGPPLPASDPELRIPVANDGAPSSLASTAYPLANPGPGFSLLGDRGVLAGTCADEGWDYVFSFAEDARTEAWDKGAARSHRSPGAAVFGCGYGYDGFFDGADGHVMLDVGANMGLSLMPYLSKGWRIIAFEPIADNVRALRGNVFINGIGDDRVALVEGAVTNRSGLVEVYAPRGRADNTAVSRKGSTLNVGSEVDAYNVTAVQVDKYIDNLVSADVRNNIMLVKIDTQGHELSVLQGMEKFLSDPPSREDLRGWSFVVIAEYDVNLQLASGHGLNDMLDFMRKLGYQVRCKMDDEPILPPALPRCPDVIFSKEKPTKPSLG